LQPNGASFLVGGFTTLQLVPGAKADGTEIPVPANIGILQFSGSGTQPVITASNRVAFTEGEFKAITVTTVSGAPLSITSGALPSWTALDLNSGRLTAISPPASSSPTVLSLTGINSQGVTLRLTLTLVVNSPVTITTQPAAAVVAPGGNVGLTVSASGTAPYSYQWQRNGIAITGATSATLTLLNLQPTDAGAYAVVVSNVLGSIRSNAAIVGLTSTAKVTGAGTEVGANILHPGGNTYDQVLLTGAAATITADTNQVTRISFLDLNDDIVQVEFAGAGTLALSLANVSGPAAPVKYNQPAVTYMKGQATIIVTGANDTTNLSIFSVGRANAVNQALFRDDVTYDGFADIAFVAIASSNGKFGGLRTANASYFGTSGLTGVNAPGVQFTGPVFIGDMNASDTAVPVILLGSAGDVRITGGDMLQANSAAVEVSGITQLKFAAGTTSHGTLLPAQANRARFLQNGVDVTTQIVTVTP
jgi:hypothetical protein